MQKIKVKRIEKKRLAKELEAFLISRYYPELRLQEYVVCTNYDFRTNTYFRGNIVMRLDLAYKEFNGLINKIMIELYELQNKNSNDELNDTETRLEDMEACS